MAINRTKFKSYNYAMEENNMKINATLLIRFTELLRRFYTYYTSELNALDTKDVHAKFLHMIADHPGMTQQEIANLSMMKRSTVSEIMSQMVGLNLVRRDADSKDGRVLRIYLTQQGKTKPMSLSHYLMNLCLNAINNSIMKKLNNSNLSNKNLIIQSKPITNKGQK